MVASLGKVALVGGPYFSSPWIFHVTPSSLKCFSWVIRCQSNWCSLVDTYQLFLLAFRILSLSLSLVILIMMFLDVGLFGSNLFRILWVSWACVTFSFTRLGKFLVIISSNRFSIPCSVYSPSDIPMMQMLLHFMLSKMFLNLSLFFFLFAALPGCFFFYLVFQNTDSVLCFI